MVDGRWYHSSSFRGTFGAITQTLGKISVMKPAAASYIQVCFTPLNLTRQCPTQNRFTWGSATVDAWRNAGYRSYTIAIDEVQEGAGGQSEEADVSSMSPPTEAEPDTPGTDGGPMSGGDETPGED